MRRNLIIAAVVILAIVGGFFGYRYWSDAQTRIYLENAEVSAPVISVGPSLAGVLQDVYVKQGDMVMTDQHLFNVGGKITTAVSSGIVTSVQNTPGQIVSGASAIVQMYDPQSLRVVGHVQEDQGLKDIHVGQKVTFTVDAFGSKEYQGTVESVANIPDTSSVVFSISDKRQEKDFSVKVDFDLNAYPELVNGMSAKMWIHK
jgi:multidrug resistance efflux pump